MVSYRHGAPWALLTEWRGQTDEGLGEPVYFFRFLVLNDGKSQARECEAVLDALWLYNAAGEPMPCEDFSPVSLRFDDSRTRFLSLNPDRRVFWALGHISSPAYQRKHEAPRRIEVPGEHGSDLRFMFANIDSPHGQPNCIPPGRFACRVLITAENAATQVQCYEVVWNGSWQPGLTEMLREVVIRPIPEPRSGRGA